jgi:uncharacterized protein (TIGR03435 family)
MKSDERALRELVDRSIPTPSDLEMESRCDRVLQNLQSGNMERLAAGQPVVSRPRIGLRFAVAAALMLTVAIGVYAFRAQRVSSPKVEVPAAPSVNAAAGTPQVAVLTPGSTKPGAAPSREEALARAAAQIAAAQASDAGAARPKFAAASVRPIGRGEGSGNLTCLGADGQLWKPGGGQNSPARRGACRAGTFLSTLVIAAYATSQRVEMLGFPFKSERRLTEPHFQIEAIADDPERVTKRELQQMLQTLLEDRFKARVHFETREVDGFVLTIAKSGIKFKETSEPPLVSRGTPRMLGTYNMEKVIDHLGFQLGVEPVLDKTGLTGVYDIKLAIERIQVGPPPPGNARGGPDDGPRLFNPPVPKAFEDQLGLHLERGKVPVQFIVVDHLEMPTEN